VSHATKIPAPEALLTPAEVATLFRVDPKTVTRWAKAGKIDSLRTLGGHRRYREADVRALLSGGDTRTLPRMYDVKAGQRVRLAEDAVVTVSEVEPLGDGMLRFHLGLGQTVDVHGNSRADIVAPDAGAR
jgi:excisionase family DNA binding protein